MLQNLLELFGDSHFEAYVGGPIAGVIAGALFAGLGTPAPATGLSQQDPVQVRIRIEHHYHAASQRQQSSSGPNENPAILIGFMSVIAVFLFGAFLPELAHILNFFIVTLGMFALTATSLALLTKRSNNWQWVSLAARPLLITVGSFYVAAKASSAINPNVIAFARSLLSNQQFSLPALVNAALLFLKQIHSEYFLWMVFDMAAFVCVILCGSIAFFQCVHYVALANSNNGHSPFWERVALRTRRYATFGSTLFAAILLVTGWLLASGYAYWFFHG